MRDYLEAIRHAVEGALDRLNPRERLLVTVFGALAALSLVYVAAIEPFFASQAGLTKRVAGLERDLSTMDALALKIRGLETELAAGSTDRGTSEGFSLFSFIDKATSSSVNADAIASMNPTRRKLPEGVEETAVELKLEDVALGEVVGLLRQIERSSEPVYIKRLDLRRRYNDRTRFDATIVAGSLSTT